MEITVASSLYEKIKDYDTNPKPKLFPIPVALKEGTAKELVPSSSRIGCPDHLFTTKDIPNLDMDKQKLTILSVAASPAKRRSAYLTNTIVNDKYTLPENNEIGGESYYSFNQMFSSNAQSHLTWDDQIDPRYGPKCKFITASSNKYLRHMFIYCFKDVWVGMYVDLLKDVFEPGITLAQYVVMFKRPKTKKKLLEKIEFISTGIENIKHNIDVSDLEFVTHSDGNQYVRYTFSLTKDSPELNKHAHLISHILSYRDKTDTWIIFDSLVKSNPGYTRDNFNLLKSVFDTKDYAYSNFLSKLNVVGLKLFIPFMGEIHESGYMTTNYILSYIMNLSGWMYKTFAFRYGFLTFASELKPCISDLFPSPINHLIGQTNQFDANKLINNIRDLLKAEYTFSLLSGVSSKSTYTAVSSKFTLDQIRSYYETSEPSLYFVGRKSNKDTNKDVLYFLRNSFFKRYPGTGNSIKESYDNMIKLIDSFVDKINTSSIRSRFHKIFAPLFDLTEKDIYTLNSATYCLNSFHYLSNKYKDYSRFLYEFIQSAFIFHLAYPDAPIDLYNKTFNNSFFPVLTILHKCVVEGNSPLTYTYSSFLADNIKDCPELDDIIDNNTLDIINKYVVSRDSNRELHGVSFEFTEFIKTKIAPSTLVKWMNDILEEQEGEMESEYNIVSSFVRGDFSRQNTFTDMVSMIKNDSSVINLIKDRNISQNISCENFHDMILNVILENPDTCDQKNSIVLPTVLFPEPVRIKHDAFKHRQYPSMDETISAINFKDSTWEFSQPKTTSAMKMWSKLVSNCVGTSSGYSNDIKDKRSFIVFVRINEKPRITIQMKLKGNELVVTQVRDLHNAVLSPIKHNTVKEVMQKALGVVASRLEPATI